MIKIYIGDIFKILKLCKLTLLYNYFTGKIKIVKYQKCEKV